MRVRSVLLCTTKAPCLRHSVVDDTAGCRGSANRYLRTPSLKNRIWRIRLYDRKVFKLVIPKFTLEIGTVSCAADRESEFMTRTILNYGQGRLIALRCSSEEDLGNISKRFYEEFHTKKGRCPYAASYQAPKMQMLMTMENSHKLPRPCRVQGINAGEPLFQDFQLNDLYSKHTNKCCEHPRNREHCGLCDPHNYYYDFVIMSECGQIDECLDDFLQLKGLREVEDRSTYMSKEELCSILQQRQKSRVNV